MSKEINKINGELPTVVDQIAERTLGLEDASQLKTAEQIATLRERVASIEKKLEYQSDQLEVHQSALEIAQTPLHRDIVKSEKGQISDIKFEQRRLQNELVKAKVDLIEITNPQKYKFIQRGKAAINALCCVAAVGTMWGSATVIKPFNVPMGENKTANVNLVDKVKFETLPHLIKDNFENIQVYNQLNPEGQKIAREMAEETKLEYTYQLRIKELLKEQNENK